MTTTPTPRPVPTTEDRMMAAITTTDVTGVVHAAPQPKPAADPRREMATFATYLDRTERDQLDAKAACAQQERDEALDDRDAYKEARDVLRKQLDQVQQRNRDLTNLLRQKRDTITALAAELGDAHDLIAEIRNNRANDDRAFARWETRQPGLGSLPPRAQDEPAGRPICGDSAHRHNGPCQIYARKPRAQELPAWVLDLVRGLDRYELEHPQLFRRLDGTTYVEWPCPGPLLARVPAEVRRLAEREG